MKNLRNLLATVTLMTVLMISSSTAKAGILMSDLVENRDTQLCTETKKTDWSNTIQDLTSIVIQGFTGIIVQGAVDPSTDCGIIVQD